MTTDEFLADLEIELLDRYNCYQKMYRKSNCKVQQCQVYSLEHEAFHLSFSVLKEAIFQIKMDIKILSIRRGNLIGDMRMSEGKIAGAVTYRLAKAQIIHIHRKCNVCGEKCFSRLNNLIAVSIGLDYVHKKYTELPEGIRKELFYTIKQRHVNQETLGLVFDTFPLL